MATFEIGAYRNGIANGNVLDPSSAGHYFDC
jgi:hypothetical protein